MKIATYLSSALFLFSCGYLQAAKFENKSQAQSNTQKVKQYTDRIIVKMKSGIGGSFTTKSLTSGDTQAILSRSAIKTMADDSGESLSYVRTMRGTAGHVVKLNRMVSLDEVSVIATEISKNNDLVEYAEPDARMFPAATIPNDEFYVTRQWNLHDSADQGLNLPNAWDHTTGSTDVVVAVLDTGILGSHADFEGRLLAGYDLISVDVDDDGNEDAMQLLIANDGGGRDADSTDPGDWVTTSDAAQINFTNYECAVVDSSWHGTHVAGIIGASSDNSEGVTGVDWKAKLLPVRVLGKCGGYISDIADGIYWAAGLPVTGTSINTNPANIINMSIGGEIACGETYQNAIDAAREQGAVIVVAAGNESANVSTSAPANCANVIAVAAHGKSGEVASYSNTGVGIDVMAPGGDDFVNCDDSHGSIFSLGDSGDTVAINDDAYLCMNGTSMAAPHISGLAALMISKNPNLTPDQIESGIKDNIRAFIGGSTCTTATCGAGIADAEAAILATALPVTPSDLVVTEVDFDLKFDWTDNSVLEKGFKIERDVDGQGFEELATIEKDITTYTDESVIDDATLTYRVSSVNGAYFDGYANQINIEKALVTASALATEEVSSTQAKLTWLDGSNVELGYQIDRSDNDNSNFKRLHVAASDTSSYTDSGLIDGTFYYYKIQTITASGLNDAIEEIEVFTDISEPTYLTGQSTSSKVSLTWTDNSATETGFKLERSTDGVNYTQIAELAAQTTQYTDANVSGSSFYYYRVKAYKDENDSESIYSEVTSLSTPSSTKGAGTLHWYLMFALLILVGRVKSIKA
jgi:serine protease